MDADYLKDRLRTDCGLTADELSELLDSGLLSREETRRARGLLVVETGVVNYFPGLATYEGKTPGGRKFRGFRVGRGKGYWPTPSAADALGGKMPRREQYFAGVRPDGSKVQRSINAALRYETENQYGAPNPDWLETLMGFPIGWSDTTKDDV